MQAVQDLKELLPQIIEHLLGHLDYEEIYINHLQKKYLNPKIARKLVRPHFLLVRDQYALFLSTTHEQAQSLFYPWN